MTKALPEQIGDSGFALAGNERWYPCFHEIWKVARGFLLWLKMMIDQSPLSN